MSINCFPYQENAFELLEAMGELTCSSRKIERLCFFYLIPGEEVIRLRIEVAHRSSDLPVDLSVLENQP